MGNNTQESDILGLKMLDYNDTKLTSNQKSVTYLEKDSKSNNIDTVWSPQLALQLSSMILLFGIIVFALMTYLVNKKHNPNDILRIFALPLIVVSSIFLIVVGYSQEQIAPVIGLLGTIAGYLLGSKSNKADKEDTNTKAE